MSLNAVERGILVGVLVGEGSFGGDGKQPQITLRMHTRHESLFHWLKARFPNSKLYGPYTHANRSYYQWMARGKVLIDEVLPILKESLTPEIDAYAYSRMEAMIERYRDVISRLESVS